jgi:hypothetical protein
MASSLQLAQASWQYRLKATHQPPRPHRKQPIEAPQLATDIEIAALLTQQPSREKMQLIGIAPVIGACSLIGELRA